MLKIRLRRMGKRHSPFYRVVVSDSRRVPTASAVDEVGHYDPQPTPPRLVLDLDRLKRWQQQGAVLSPTVARLVKRVESGALAAPAAGEAKPAGGKKAAAKAEKPAEAKAEKPAEVKTEAAAAPAATTEAATAEAEAPAPAEEAAATEQPAAEAQAAGESESAEPQASAAPAESADEAAPAEAATEPAAEESADEAEKPAGS
jgi:small subunit ribosomal protein S16